MHDVYYQIGLEALADLLPEVQFHSHDRLRLTLLFLLGVGIAFTLGFLEPAH